MEIRKDMKGQGEELRLALEQKRQGVGKVSHSLVICFMPRDPIDHDRKQVRSETISKAYRSNFPAYIAYHF
jgi:hypothetical protein